MRATAIATGMVLLAAACGGEDVTEQDPEDTATVEQSLVPASPANAIPVPADYDGDGTTDMALKGANGYWYIDYGNNGFGGRWNVVVGGYGPSSAVPVPADYDGDGKADLAVKDSAGMWAVDYAANGFGAWDLQLWGYGDAWAVPAPADYDGDGRADLSVKSASSGTWFVNYSADGFATGWNASFAGYGGSSATPVPADYDGDGHADLSVKDSNGCWHIDYWAQNNFGAWNEIRCGYGNATAVPAPADYDNDGWTDLAVKGNDGKWFIDLAAGGFGAWNAIHSGYGPNSALAAPGDYSGDGLLDLSSYFTTTGNWGIDYASSFAGWQTLIYNPGRTLVDARRPYISATAIYNENNLPVSQLTVGVRYTIDLTVQRGSGVGSGAFCDPDGPPTCPADQGCVAPPGGGAGACRYGAGVEINDELNVPESLRIANRRGSTYVAEVGAPTTHRRFSIVCTEPGNFPLGYQMRSAPPYYGGQVYNPDYGIRVLCVSPAGGGLSGRVTAVSRTQYGLAVPGPAISEATVTVESGASVPPTSTNLQGNWSLPITGGPLTLKVSRQGYSDVKIVNLNVPPGGAKVDVAMEVGFPLLPSGVTYKTYVDYSAGRTLMHAVEIAPQAGKVAVGRAASTPGACLTGCGTWCPAFDQLADVGATLGSNVIMNATWWNVCNGNPQGYVYAQGFLDSEVWCDNRGGPTNDCSGSNVYYAEGTQSGLYPAGTSPMLTIVGTAANQGFDIVASGSNFLDASSTEWNQVGSPLVPIWDVAPGNGVSDVTYAVQIPNPPLLLSGLVIGGGDFQYDLYGNYDYHFARTTVGVGPTGKLYMVAADGENVHGGHGATGNQMGRFYRDVLQAEVAMGLDSGLSTELLLRTPSGLRRVNTITGEDATIQINPYTEVLPLNDGAIGSVGYYLSVGP